MEPITGAVIAVFAAFYIGANQGKQAETIKPLPSEVRSEIATCAQICEQGTVESYKWCKCNVNAFGIGKGE